MTDRECIEFLQWALPRMRMHWPGFRKVRGQVARRITRRIGALHMTSVSDYRAYLEETPDEWATLASLCRVTISRFYRDRGVFDRIGGVVLPRLAERVEGDVRCWSAGCASGEEAYTMQILWTLRVASTPGERALHILGTDSDRHMLERARRAVYPPSALKNLPPDILAQAFDRSGEFLRLKTRFMENVAFEEHDIRESMPRGPFDIILCRNLVLTYFDEALRREIVAELLARLRKGGVFVIGVHESLPEGRWGLTAVAPAIYERPQA